MINFLIIISLAFFFLLLLRKFITSKLKDEQKNKLPKNSFYIPELRENCDPDIDTLNWNLHKYRLNKFGRSQYKGLTFFINEQGQIYYLNEDGIKVYC
jgi:hypothetical protein